jgi:carbon-monoxide dehydrogenase small subunit
MKIQVTINEEQVTVDVDPEMKLLLFLRSRGLMSPKQGCGEGNCGACTVLLDDEPVPSCLVPMAAVRNSAIVTLEHFAKTPEYADIQQGFAQTNVYFCGFCNAGKIFAAYQLLKSRGERLERTGIIATMESLTCRCMDTSRIASGVLIAANIRRKRESKRERNDARK